MDSKKWLVLPGMSEVFDYFIDVMKGYVCGNSDVSGRPLLIIGDSGVGKSMFIEAARQLFLASNPSAPFLRLNCASFEESLANSELFGHVKGAFTGAHRDKVGIVKTAEGGLLVLDEIGELSKEIQAKLLVFIEEGEYRRVGSDKIEHSSLQIIGTTNRQKEYFRDDFWYRFFPVFVPSLYERRCDILYYIFLNNKDIFSRLVPRTALELLSHNWPGNMRELDRVISFIMLKDMSNRREIEEDEILRIDSEHDSMSDEERRDIEKDFEDDILFKEFEDEMIRMKIQFPEDERETSLANNILNKFSTYVENKTFNLLDLNLILREYGLQFPYYFETEEELFEDDKCVFVSKNFKTNRIVEYLFNDKKMSFKRKVKSIKMSVFDDVKNAYPMGMLDRFYENLAQNTAIDSCGIDGLDGFIRIKTLDAFDDIFFCFTALCRIFLRNSKSKLNVFDLKERYFDFESFVYGDEYFIIKKINNVCSVRRMIEIVVGSKLVRADMVVDGSESWDMYLKRVCLNNYNLFRSILNTEDEYMNCECGVDFSGYSEAKLLHDYYNFLKDKYKTNREACDVAGLNESTFRFRLKKYGVTKSPKLDDDSVDD